MCSVVDLLKQMITQIKWFNKSILDISLISGISFNFTHQHSKLLSFWFGNNSTLRYFSSCVFLPITSRLHSGVGYLWVEAHNYPYDYKQSGDTSRRWFLTIAGRLFSAHGPLSSEQPGRTFPHMIGKLLSAVCLVSRRQTSWLHKQADSSLFALFHMVWFLQVVKHCSTARWVTDVSWGSLVCLDEARKVNCSNHVSQLLFVTVTVVSVCVSVHIYILIYLHLRKCFHGYKHTADSFYSSYFISVQSKGFYKNKKG